LPLSALLLALCLVGTGDGPSWTWMWDRVSDDDVVSYRVEIAARVPTYYPCLGEDGEPAECVTYPAWSSLSWSVAETVEQEAEVPDGWSLCSTWDRDGVHGATVPEGRDALLYVNVRAVDATGNVSN